MDSVLNARIKSAAEVLSPYIADCIAILTKVLNALGVDDSSVGIRILQSTVTEEEFLTALSQKKGMSEDLPGPRVRAAFEILKGNDPFRISEPKPDQNPVADQSANGQTWNSWPGMGEIVQSKSRKNSPAGPRTAHVSSSMGIPRWTLRLPVNS